MNRTLNARKLLGGLLTLAFAATTVACGSSAQSEAEEASSSEASSAATYYTVASGTSVALSLDQRLSTENTSKGDRLSATVTSPVTQGGHVLVPEGSTVEGEVTALQEAEGERPALLKLDFKSIEVRGQSKPLAATLTSAEVETKKELEGEAKKIGGGAAAGAVVGGILSGDAKGALIGAAAGAAAGTAITLGTRENKAFLPAGTPMQMRLDQTLRVQL